MCPLVKEWHETLLGRPEWIGRDDRIRFPIGLFTIARYKEFV